MPGPEEAVIVRSPAAAAPSTMLIAAVSDSAWTNVPPAAGNSSAALSVISLAGVIG